MNIEDLKKQEDLKETLVTLLNEVNLKIDEKAKKYVRAAEKDFRQYFAEKGFTVRKDDNFDIITASYGNLSGVLKYDEKSSTYMGSLFVFDLTATLPDKMVYTVSLHSKRPGVVITRSEPNSEERLLQDIEAQRTRLENIENEVWFYMLKKQTGVIPAKCAAETPPVFESMYEVLDSIAK